MSDSEELDRELRQVGFTPRASLGPEIRGRAARGEVPRRFPREPRIRSVMVGTAALVVITLAGWQVYRYRSVSVDHCCQDLDGGGSPDDGVLIVTRAGVAVQDLRIYEDLDRSGGYTLGDPVRFLRGSAPSVTGPVDGSQTREFCCLDYDGGGPSDDALVVVGQPPDRITMAAIYERRSSGGTIRLR